MFVCPRATSRTFLGSGAVGVKPFGVISYSARVSPHAEIGYEKNGQVLAGRQLRGYAPPIAKGRFQTGLYIRLGPTLASLSDLRAHLISTANVCLVSHNFSQVPYTDLGHCSDISLHHIDARNYTSQTSAFALVWTTTSSTPRLGSSIGCCATWSSRATCW